MKPNRNCFVLVLLFALTQLAPNAQAQAPRKAEAKPKPDLVDFKYGPHERNVLDLWKAKSTEPTPLVVFIHGGGFHAGSKEALSAAMLAGLLKNGISVIRTIIGTAAETRRLTW